MSNYLIIPFFSLLLSLSSVDNRVIVKNIQFISFAFFCAVFIGVKYNSDPDFNEYINFVNLSLELDFNLYLDQLFVEPSYYFVSRIFGSGVFFIFALYSLFALYVFYSKYEGVGHFAYLFCLSTIFYLIFFIQIRWGVAIVSIALSYYYFQCKKYHLHLIFSVISLISHFFALPFILLIYCSAYFSYNKALYLLVFYIIIDFVLGINLISILSYISSFGLLPEYINYKLSAYVQAFQHSEPFYYLYLFKYISLILIIHLFIKDDNCYGLNTYYILLVLFFYSLIDVGLFSQRTSALIEIFFSLSFATALFKLFDFKKAWLIFFIILSCSWSFNLFLLFWKGSLFEYKHLLF